MNIDANVQIEAMKLAMIRFGKKGNLLPPVAVKAISEVTKNIVKRDPKCQVVLVGGADRTSKGEQGDFKDIDIAVVASGAEAYREFGSLEFQKKMQLLSPHIHVDILAYRGKHFRNPAKILKELELEKKQGTYTISMLAKGTALYNPIQVKKFQSVLKSYLNMAYDPETQKKITEWHIARSFGSVKKATTPEKRFFGISNIFKKRK